MAHIFKLSSLHQAWQHRPGRMGPLIRLNAGLLIGTHHMHTLRMQLWRVMIQLTDGLDVVVELLRILGSPVIEPIAGLMRVQVRVFLKNAQYSEAKYW